MEKIRAAVIGLGRIASLLEDDPRREKPCTHAGAIAANPLCILAGGFDIDAGRRELFAERWNCPVYGDASEMIRDCSPGIVHIATHPDSHYRYCALAERQGVPLVVCEKPLSDTLGGAKKIAAIHRRGTTRIITNHERRYSEDYIKARKILQSGDLGNILGIRGTLYMGETRRLLDVLWHDGTHLADSIMYLGGGNLTPGKVWGQSLKKRDGTAYISGSLSGAGRREIPVLLELGAGRDHLVFEIEISLAKGRLRIGNGIFEVWKSDESPYAVGFRSLKKEITAFPGPTSYFANMMQDAVDCFRNPAKMPGSSALDGLAVIRYLRRVGAWR